MDTRLTLIYISHDEHVSVAAPRERFIVILEHGLDTDVIGMMKRSFLTKDFDVCDKLALNGVRVLLLPAWIWIIPVTFRANAENDGEG